MAKKSYNTRKVYVLQNGVIVETFNTLTSFHANYPVAAVSTISKRIKSCVDGWLPDGKKARFRESIDDEGRPLDFTKVHLRPNTPTKKTVVNDDVLETERKIDELYAAYERGEITIEERQTRVGWLQNHVAVLKNRLKRKKS